MKNSEISLSEYRNFKYQLNQEGIPLQEVEGKFKNYRSNFDYNFIPLVSYSNDINGGNPSKPLELGSYEFIGATALESKSGILLGLEAGVQNRYFYDYERYVESLVGARYDFSPKYSQSIRSSNIRLCSKNHLKDWWYLDSCLERKSTKKYLTTNKNSELSLKVSKLEQFYPNHFTETSFALSENSYDSQNQMLSQVLLKTAHNANLVSKFSLKLGKPIPKQSHLNKQIEASLGSIIGAVPIELRFSYYELKGGLILGFPVKERNSSISVEVAINRRIKLTVGVEKNNSNLTYFEDENLIFSISLLN